MITIAGKFDETLAQLRAAVGDVPPEMAALMRSWFYAGFAAALHTNTKIAELGTRDGIANLSALHDEAQAYALSYGARAPGATH